MSWSVVVPTNRPERFERFMGAWGPLFEKHSVKLYVIQDSPRGWDYVWWGGWMQRLDHREFPDFIPRNTDMCRSLGIYQAWCGTKLGMAPDYTLSLDDDVLPDGDPFEAYEAVFDAGAPCSDYLDVGAITSYPGQLRGFPFADRAPAEVAVQYGGWNGVLDFDAPTQLANQPGPHTFATLVVPVPRGAAVTGCIMNCAWRTEYAPIMWQLPLDAQGRYNRFGDIWSCLFQKRVLDALGKVMVINGKASVRHERASDPIANLERETPGVRINERLWEFTDIGYPSARDLTDAYRSVTDASSPSFDPDYEKHFLDSRNKWLALFA